MESSSSVPQEFADFPAEDGQDYFFDPMADFMFMAAHFSDLMRQQSQSGAIEDDSGYKSRKRRSVYSSGHRYLPWALPDRDADYSGKRTPFSWTDIGKAFKKLLRYSPSYRAREHLRKQFDRYGPITWADSNPYPTPYRYRYRSYNRY